MGTRERRQREAQGRRHSILAAARKLFFQQGYAATTMPQIAAAAELAPGTLYLYFPAKDALYAELLTEGYELLLAQLAQRAQKPAAPRRQAEALIDAFFTFARDHREYFQIIFFLLQLEDAANPSHLPAPQMQRLKEQENRCKAIAAEVLQKVNTTISPADLRAAVDAMWSMLAGVVFYFRNDRQYTVVARAARRLLLDAVFGGPGR